MQSRIAQRLEVAHENVTLPALNHSELANVEIIHVVALFKIKFAQRLPFIRNNFLALFLESLGSKELFSRDKVDGLLLGDSGQERLYPVPICSFATVFEAYEIVINFLSYFVDSHKFSHADYEF